VVAALFAVATRSASAAPPSPAPPDTAEPDPDPDPTAAAAALKRARDLLALVGGTLDPRTDAEALLVLSLDDLALVGDSGEPVSELLGSVPASPSAWVAPKLEGLSGPQALRAALVAVLSLPAERREAVLAAHADKQAGAQDATEGEALRAAQAAATNGIADQLEQYLAGTLDVAVVPSELTRIDLGSSTEFGLAPSRRQQWLAGKPTTAGSEASPTDPLASAQARLDKLRRQYVRLSASERAQLLETHTKRREAAEAAAETAAAAEAEAEAAAAAAPQETEAEVETAQIISAAESEAEAAASAREAALEVARLANTEAKRIVAEERARLLGVKEAQALYAAEVNRRKSAREVNRDKALEWSRRVSELAKSTQFVEEKAEAADPLYDEIRSDLSAMREALRAELKKIRAAGTDVPQVGEGLDRELPPDVERGDLATLREELEENEKTLTELEQAVGWELAQGIRDDVVLLNKTRLALLELASPSLRAGVTGFGAAGVDQIKRELDQIRVELGFYALKIPRYRDGISTWLEGSAIALIVGAAEFFLALAAYLWWRRNGERILGRFSELLRERPTTRATSIAGMLLWYLQRVRRPLELLLVLWVLFGSLGNLDDLPEFNLLWIVALWVLLGLGVILLVDAIAARETLYSTDTRDNSALRIHSLRLVGLNVIVIGLILSLTSAVVGKGAIYSWVISTCWILSFPVALYLVHKWRPIIFSMVKLRPEQGPFTQWVTANKEGVASFVAAAAAAGYLLGAGIASWIMRQLSGFEATRRLLAYLFRREVAKRAAATEADDRFVRVNDDVYAAFDPEVVPAALLEEVAGAHLEKVVEKAGDPRATLSAIVGERGAGKSTVLRRLELRLGPDRMRVLSCPEEGFGALTVQLAEVAGDASLRGEALCAALRELGPFVIAIDDAQRLVIPAVDGLQGLDQFTTLARDVGGEISWVVTIGAASWHYVRRARGDRVFFEQVVTLPRWTEEELGMLIQAQCEAANITPSFDGLVVPRQASGPLTERGNKSEAAYYRLLWDFSRGNPAVALHAFRESLFVAGSGDIVVRLFKEPPQEQIEDLPLSILFVLRTIVQLELAMPREVELATQLPAPDVDDAIRFAVSRGYLEPYDGGVRMSWPWYRTITTVLNRQHLLSAL